MLYLPQPLAVDVSRRGRDKGPLSGLQSSCSQKNGDSEFEEIGVRGLTLLIAVTNFNLKGKCNHKHKRYCPLPMCDDKPGTRAIKPHISKSWFCDQTVRGTSNPPMIFIKV